MFLVKILALAVSSYVAIYNMVIIYLGFTLLDLASWCVLSNNKLARRVYFALTLSWQPNCAKYEDQRPNGAQCVTLSCQGPYHITAISDRMCVFGAMSGAFFFTLGIIGVIGALSRNRSTLTLYLAMLMYVNGACVYALSRILFLEVYFDEERDIEFLVNLLERTFVNAPESADYETAYWTHLMMKNDCCGISSTEDFYRITAGKHDMSWADFYLGSKLPIACCNMTYFPAQENWNKMIIVNYNCRQDKLNADGKLKPCKGVFVSEACWYWGKNLLAIFIGTIGLMHLVRKILFTTCDNRCIRGRHRRIGRKRNRVKKSRSICGWSGAYMGKRRCGLGIQIAAQKRLMRMGGRSDVPLDSVQSDTRGTCRSSCQHYHTRPCVRTHPHASRLCKHEEIKANKKHVCYREDEKLEVQEETPIQ